MAHMQHAALIHTSRSTSSLLEDKRPVIDLGASCRCVLVSIPCHIRLVHAMFVAGTFLRQSACSMKAVLSNPVASPLEDSKANRNVGCMAPPRRSQHAATSQSGLVHLTGDDRRMLAKPRACRQLKVRDNQADEEMPLKDRLMVHVLSRQTWDVPSLPMLSLYEHGGGLSGRLRLGLPLVTECIRKTFPCSSMTASISAKHKP